MNEIVIKEITYKYKVTLKTYIAFERLFEDSITNIKGIDGLTKLFYASINAYNDNVNISYEDFLESIDMNTINEFAFCIADFNKLQNIDKKKVISQKTQ